MGDFYDRLKAEKRFYVTDFELAALLGLDLGDVVSAIETVSQQPECRSKFKKEDGKYILDQKALKCLFPIFSNYSSTVNISISYLTLWLSCNEKNITTDLTNF